jgi:hypothetical protein
MFEGNEYFGGQKQCFLLKTLLQCSQHCSHLRNDCPIRIVEGEADTKYKGRVLGHWLYDYTAHPWATIHYRFVRCAIHCTYDVYYIVHTMYTILYLYNVYYIVSIQYIIYCMCTMYNTVYR